MKESSVTAIEPLPDVEVDDNRKLKRCVLEAPEDRRVEYLEWPGSRLVLDDIPSPDRTKAQTIEQQPDDERRDGTSPQS